MIASRNEQRICFVNCGLPGEQCACFRALMREIYSDLLANQSLPDPDFDRVWSENADQLYEA